MTATNSEVNADDMQCDVISTSTTSYNPKISVNQIRAGLKKISKTTCSPITKALTSDSATLHLVMSWELLANCDVQFGNLWSVGLWMKHGSIAGLHLCFRCPHLKVRILWKGTHRTHRDAARRENGEIWSYQILPNQIWSCQLPSRWYCPWWSPSDRMTPPWPFHRRIGNSCHMCGQEHFSLAQVFSTAFPLLVTILNFHNGIYKCTKIVFLLRDKKHEFPEK